MKQMVCTIRDHGFRVTNAELIRQARLVANTLEFWDAGRDTAFMAKVLNRTERDVEYALWVGREARRPKKTILGVAA
jgi:hypothetical protein